MISRPDGQNEGNSADNAEPVIRVEDLRKSFDRDGDQVVALDGVNFHALPGQVTGLVGPDAAGKTTLLRILAGLISPDDGRVEVLGLDAAERPRDVQASVAYMPQTFGLYQELTVQQNLDLWADLHGVGRSDRQDRYEKLMEMAGLDEFRQRLAGDLSGGMKQKLGLSCSLVRTPSLLLLDEPTVGVDPLSRRQLWSIIYQLVEDEQITVVLSTAYLDEAQRCNEVAVIHEGRLLGQDAPQTFIQAVQNRCWSVTPGQLDRRRAQQELSQRDEVLDAVLRADQIHLLLTEDAHADPGDWLDDDQARAEQAEPIFEDAFIDMLQSGSDRQEVETIPVQIDRSDQDEPVIEVEQLRRAFGDFYAVDGLSFQVRRGEIFGLLGANGAGKSTTFRMLCGLLSPTDGRVEVVGHDLRQAPAEARARIGYMSQSFSLYQTLSPAQNLRFFGGAYGLTGRSGRRRIEKVAASLQLGDFIDSPSGSLPLGYKQRLAMAAAMLHEPEILFLDEPTSGVDPLARREFWAQIIHQSLAGVTVMITTHFMVEAEYCDRLAIMSAGKILTIGTPAEIRNAAASEEHPEPTMEDAFIQLIQSQQDREQNE
ncbi:MAG: ATP-binding cassette domain-containing protein [Phycisphaerae bacterium]